MAERFLKAGYQVLLFDIDGQAAAAAASRISARAKRISLEGDVTNEDHVKNAVARAIAELGSLDVLINNAGIEINGTVVDLTAEQWEQQLAVNLRDVFLFSKYAIPAMQPLGGSIINISSVHAYVSWPRCPAYDASKSALIGLTRAMAIDHGRDRIRVNAICPGYIETPLLERWFASGIVTKEEVLKFHPLGRIGTTNDVAELALFLASDAAAFISGTSITVDGALTASGH
ncbi:MAG: SDR family oxidoreductase [Verrucomicrobia bacterium]|nr:SDR family oxidoreductase [Verrucomicrobiota bacterium]MBV8279596.1 SDR family oxidoreductase [Verrucomicrobiota bacterium]